MAQKYGNFVSCFCPPAVLEDLCRSSEGLERLSQLESVSYGGGALSPSVGNLLASRTILHNFIGFTEASAPPRYVLSGKYWQYHEFHPSSGFDAEPYGEEGLYKMIIKRIKSDDSLADVQSVFRVYPNIDRFETGDLVTRHPSVPTLWRHEGRVDDLITFSTGEKLNPVPLETIIQKSSVVKSALLAGIGLFQAVLLVELDENKQHLNRNEAVEKIWPQVLEANAAAPTQGRIAKSHIVIVPPTKSFQRSTKGTLKRKATYKLFESEIGSFSAEQKTVSNTTKINTTVSSGWQSVSDTQSTLTSNSNAELEAYLSRSLENELSQNRTIGQARQIIRHSVSMILGNHNFEDTDDFFDLGMDSQQVRELLTMLSEDFSKENGIAELNTKLIYNNASVQRLYNSLFPSSEENRSPLEQLEQSHRHGKDRDDALAKLIEDFQMSPDKMRSSTVVLTGASGSFGCYLLDRLVSSATVSKVICLTRQNNGREHQIQASALQGLDTSRLSNPDVTFPRADLSLPKLGLSETDYELVKSADHIIHNAWSVDFNWKLEHFKSVHLAGVKHLAELAAQSNRKARLWFVSSIAAAFNWTSNGKTCKVPEDIILDEQVCANTGYAQSKYVAERVLHQAALTHGVPVTIIRTGQICGPLHHLAGSWKVNDWLPILLQTSSALGLMPRSLGGLNEIDWVPTDILADTFVEIMCSHRALDRLFQVYHAVNPKRTAWSALLPAICHRMGDETILVSFNEWIDAVGKIKPTADNLKRYPAIKLLDWFRDQTRGSQYPFPRFDTSQLEAVSDTMAGLLAISGKDMELWMDQLGRRANRFGP
jgi:thioester reductase-like protein